jgi:hypothetical protein
VAATAVARCEGADVAAKATRSTAR